MIKILFFIETLEGGGAEKVLRNLVNNMDQNKFDITVQTVWPCDFDKYLIKGIKHKSMFSKYNSINSMRYRIEAETGLAYKLHVKDDYDIECAYLECGPTKVLSNSTNKKALKLAWVHCDLIKMYAKVPDFKSLLIKQYKKFDRVLCVSENVRNSFVKLFGDTVPAEVMYNTIDGIEIRTKAQMPLPADVEKRRFTVASVGRLSESKNYIRLLKAHKKLLDEGLEHDLWILGEGSDRPILEQFITENGLESSAKLFGFLNNPYCFMIEADMLVCSSDCEGYSTFIVEGIVLGKPIVTTDCGGMREILGDSEYGLITELSDEGLYEGVKKMLCDETMRNHYAEKAAERGRDFSAEALAKKTDMFFEEQIKICVN